MSLSTPSTPSSIPRDSDMLIDLDSLSDIDCGQPEDSSFLHTTMDASNDDTSFACHDASNDKVFIYKAEMATNFFGVSPDYDYAHSSTRMFGKRGSSFRNQSFEFWRRQFDVSRFNIATVTGDDFNQWVDEYVLHENVEMAYICPHKTRSRHSKQRCRVRPVCCDPYHRSCCWVDMSVTFHGSHGILMCGTLGANAPVPSFDVPFASLHPIVRTREYFHCGTSFGYPVDICLQIDKKAIDELMIGFRMMKRFAYALPVVWCHIMLMLNPYEKMIFASMLFDGNGINDYVHQLRCNKLYGFNACSHEYSMYVGHNEQKATSVDMLRRMMSARKHSPCQQLMYYGGSYDLVNMLNRHAIRREIISEWRYLIMDIGRRLLHHVRFFQPDHELCWTMCSEKEKSRYVDVWKAILRYLKMMAYPLNNSDADLRGMMFELDDIIRHFIDRDGMFSYLLSNNSVIRLAPCADISDISHMAWDVVSDVKSLIKLPHWNSNFHVLMLHTFSYLETDLSAIRDAIDIGLVHCHIYPGMSQLSDQFKWRELLADVVRPVVRFYNLFH